MDLLVFMEKTDPLSRSSEIKEHDFCLSGYLSESIGELAWRPAHELLRGVFTRVESKIEIPSVRCR
jgi:hypothetical protein